MMTATDRLRRLLDERGVEWREGSPNKTKWSHDGIEFVAVNAWPRNGGAKRLVLHANLTPEQTIEATLGSGNLTADQVRKAISIGGVWDEDSATYYVNRTDMQAIADELNAALGGGECECVWNEQDGTFRCSSCDTLLTNEISIEWPSHKVTPITLPNYCQNCGRKVTAR